MVTIDLILEEYFDLPKLSLPVCFIKKSTCSKKNTPKRGWIKVQGVEFNIERFNKMDVLFHIQYTRPYFFLAHYGREVFGFKLYIDNFVYGCLYSAIAAHLLSYEFRLPVFFGFSFKTSNKKEKLKVYPGRYVKGFRYADKDLLLVGKLILEEWLKMRRKENPSFMLEMSLS